MKSCDKLEDQPFAFFYNSFCWYAQLHAFPNLHTNTVGLYPQGPVADATFYQSRSLNTCQSILTSSIVGAGQEIPLTKQDNSIQEISSTKTFSCREIDHGRIKVKGTVLHDKDQINRRRIYFWVGRFCKVSHKRFCGWSRQVLSFICSIF